MCKQKLLEAYLIFTSFSDINESSCGWAMNLGDEYRKTLIFIALTIAGNEGWTTNLQ